MPVRRTDTERALLLLEEYCGKLQSPSERQLRLAIQKVIYMFKSNLFKALIDIQEFYEVTLLSSSIDHEGKISELNNVAELWEKNNSLSGGPESLQQASELEVLNGSNGSNTSEEPNTENQASDSSVVKKKVSLQWKTAARTINACVCKISSITGGQEVSIVWHNTSSHRSTFLTRDMQDVQRKLRPMEGSAGLPITFACNWLILLKKNS